jgi:hypothetical protein
MKRIMIFLSIIIIYALSACSPISVKIDYDSEADFSKYQTYKWIKLKKKPAAKQVKINSLNQKRIERAVEKELVTKGFEKIEKGKADLLIAAHINVKNKVDIVTYGYGYWRRPRYGGRVVEARHYKEGVLILDIVDAREKQLIWRGWAKNCLHGPDNAEEKINKAVNKILEDFPPQEN